MKVIPMKLKTITNETFLEIEEELEETSTTSATPGYNSKNAFKKPVVQKPILDSVNEAMKPNAAGLVKIFKNKKDWGDMGDQTRVWKGNLEVIDSYFYQGDKALKDLVKRWTTGEMAKFMKDKYDIKFKLVDSFQVVKAKTAGGWYKKLTDDGIVSVTLKVS